jgi:hypothetical protein
VDEVAALLRARTQDDHDDEIGTFDDNTRPTGTEVEKIIRQAATVVYGRVGSVEDDVLTCSTAQDIKDGAKYHVALLAAMLVELSYFPEQVRSDRSAFEHYRDLWDMGMDALIDAAAECRGGEVVPDEPGEGGAQYGPYWDFPRDAGGLVGWQTKW